MKKKRLESFEDAIGKTITNVICDVSPYYDDHYECIHLDDEYYIMLSKDFDDDCGFLTFSAEVDRRDLLHYELVTGEDREQLEEEERIERERLAQEKLAKDLKHVNKKIQDKRKELVELNKKAQKLLEKVDE